eukprot:545054-Lingulodinium_polyedra.AAC.1
MPMPWGCPGNAFAKPCLPLSECPAETLRTRSRVPDQPLETPGYPCDALGTRSAPRAGRTN